MKKLIGGIELFTARMYMVQQSIHWSKVRCKKKKSDTSLPKVKIHKIFMNIIKKLVKRNFASYFFSSDSKISTSNSWWNLGEIGNVDKLIIFSLSAMVQLWTKWDEQLSQCWCQVWTPNTLFKLNLSMVMMKSWKKESLRRNLQMNNNNKKIVFGWLTCCQLMNAKHDRTFYFQKNKK